MADQELRVQLEEQEALNQRVSAALQRSAQSSPAQSQASPERSEPPVPKAGKSRRTRAAAAPGSVSEGTRSQRAASVAGSDGGAESDTSFVSTIDTPGVVLPSKPSLASTISSLKANPFSPHLMARMVEVFSEANTAIAKFIGSTKNVSEKSRKFIAPRLSDLSKVFDASASVVVSLSERVVVGKRGERIAGK